MCVALQSPSAAKPENYHVTMDTLAKHYSPGLHQILQYMPCMPAFIGNSNNRLLGGAIGLYCLDYMVQVDLHGIMW